MSNERTGWRHVVSHVTYANVMATLAFAVATSGSAYAAVHINGHSIEKHSVPANRLVRGAVVPRAAFADRVQHLLITHGKLRKARKHLTVAGGASGVAADIPSTMVAIPEGGSATIFQTGPFTLTARCVNGGDGDALNIYGTATEAWFTTGYTREDGKSELVNAGDTFQVYDGGAGTDSPRAWTVLNNGVSMFGVDGQSLVLGEWTGTNNMYADCTFSGTALSN